MVFRWGEWPQGGPENGSLTRRGDKGGAVAVLYPGKRGMSGADKARGSTAGHLARRVESSRDGVTKALVLMSRPTEAGYRPAWACSGWERGGARYSLK